MKAMESKSKGKRIEIPIDNGLVVPLDKKCLILMGNGQDSGIELRSPDFQLSPQSESRTSEYFSFFS